MKLKTTAMAFALVAAPIFAKASDSIVTLTSGMKVKLEASKETIVICDQGELAPRCKLNSSYYGSYVIHISDDESVDATSYEEALEKLKTLKELDICR